MHRHCPYCNHVVPSAGYAVHARVCGGGRVDWTGWKALRRLVLERDRYRCTVPGCRATTRLEVHHLDWNPVNNRLENLATRCLAHNPRGADTHSTPAVGGPRLV
jgi:hypothetical protein